MIRAVWLFMIVPAAFFAGMITLAILIINDEDKRR